ncbi:unnamed protein product [Porites evermanni]|uniref:Uncharacterized protein n=1 Tax=Porites evermanni TaxID=104178 RepID=A0ABN8SSX4_9CNID|nr:unnamed protein product [Porites evermanni]
MAPVSNRNYQETNVIHTPVQFETVKESDKPYSNIQGKEYDNSVVLILRNVAMVLEYFNETLSRAIRGITYFFPVYSRLTIKTFSKGFPRKSYTYIVHGFHF